MATTQYVWDELSDNIVLEIDQTSGEVATYTSEPHKYGNVVSQRRSDNSSYYHFDGIGSTRALTDSLETVTDSEVFDSWGVTLSVSGATPNTLRFLGASGYFTDATTGSLSVRRRMFQPDLARWLSSDPVIADTLNRYTYCFNSPVNIVDPSGMCVVCDIVPEFAGTFEELDAKFVAGQTPHRLAGRAWQFIYDNEEEWNRREMQPIKITGAGAYHSSTRGVTLDGRRYPPSAIQSYSYLFYLVAYVKSECGQTPDCSVVLREDGRTWHWTDANDGRWVPMWGSQKNDDIIYAGERPPELPLPDGAISRLSIGNLRAPTPDGCDMAIVMADMPSQDSHVYLDQPDFRFWGTRQDFVIQTLQVTDARGNIAENGQFVHSWHIGFNGGLNRPLQPVWGQNNPLSLGPPRRAPMLRR